MDEFDRCAGWIADALEYGEGYDIEDVRAEVLAGTAMLWPGEKSAIVTQFIDTPKIRFLHFWLAGGDLEELTFMRRRLEAWGKEQGCQKASIAGRKGWARIYKDEGYRPSCEVSTRDL